MFVTGPDVVKTVIHEEVSKEELGGAMAHSSKSGVTHFICNTEEELLMSIRELLSFLPQNNMDETKKQNCTDEINREDTTLDTIVPTDPNVPYDMKDIIERVVDNGYFFEVMPNFAKNIIIGFARLAGRSVGIVANQPAYLAGVLDIDASDKASRFIRFCDCFNIPLITFEDVPGSFRDIHRKITALSVTEQKSFMHLRKLPFPNSPSLPAKPTVALTSS